MARRLMYVYLFPVAVANGAKEIRVKDVVVISWWLGSRVVSVLDSGAEGLGSNRSRDAVG